METTLLVIQIIVSTLLTLLILVQAKGSGISSVFGGQGGFYRSKRGIEKLFVIFTIILAVIFLVLSVIQVII
ncbi:MAG: preprotein translocase subunit SecG [Candidatus Curtissbacteria bacterium]